MLATAYFMPDKAASWVLAACDEMDVEPVAVPIIDQPSRHSPVVIKLRGDRLRHVRSLLQIKDERGQACMCSGDYRVRLYRWKVPLALFRGHLHENSASLVGSFGILTLDSGKAHQLAAFLRPLSHPTAKTRRYF